MRKRLVRVAAPFTVAALVLGGTSVAASATSAAHAKPTYTIAYEGPLSGGNAALGLNMTFAVQLAIQQFNKNPNRLFNLKFKSLNDQGSPALAPTEARIAVQDSNVVGVVGPAFSGATKNAQAVYGPANMPLISPSATNTKLTSAAEDPHRNFFRVVASDAIQGRGDADYATATLKATKIYVVNDGSDYGAGLAAQFNTEAKKDHATTTTTTDDGTVQCGDGTGATTEYAPLAATIASAKPNLVFYAGYYCDFALFTNALKTAGYTGKLMSGDGSDDPHYVLGVTPHSKANGVYLSCACEQLGNSAADKAFRAGFLVKSKGVPPGTYSPEAYDAANTFIAAINKLITAHKAVTRKNLVAELKVITYVGLTKTVHFLASGDISGKAVFMNKVESGKIVQLGLA